MDKILLIIKIPPPLTGATYLNELLSQSKILHTGLRVDCLTYTFKKSFRKRNYFQSGITIFRLATQIIYKSLSKKYSMVYFQLSPVGLAFIRDAFFVFLLKIFHRKTVLHLHGLGIKKSSQGSILIKWLYKEVFDNCYIITVSKKVLYDLEGLTVKRKFILPNAIPHLSLTPLRSRNQVCKILFFSNLFIFKGLFDLLAALGSLKCRGFHFTLSIAGEEGDIKQNELFEEIRHFNLEKEVEYIGIKYGKEKRDVFSSHDVFVFPSKNDIWGLVILEAMQASLPVVAYDTGAVSDMVEDGKNGFLCKVGDVEDMSLKIAKLIDNPALCIKFGTNGREKYISNFTFDRYEDQINSIFKQVILGK